MVWLGIIVALGLLSQRSMATAPDMSEASIRGHMEFLAGDALRGRGSGTPDEFVAATYLASQLRRWGVEPLGDAGSYLQRITTPSLEWRADAEPSQTWNVIGRLTGRDQAVSDEVILLTAHIDSLGAYRTAGGPLIYYGADDDASGMVAVLELAESFAKGPRPRRSLVFAWFGSEEAGGFGARQFVETPPVPLARIVANLEFEMIGRRDPMLAPRTLWLAGYHRTTLGAELALRGAKLVADPRPELGFFERSDNFQLATRGVVAHTVSSFGLHRDYHQPSDDLSRIDFAHLAGVIRLIIPPVRWLANGSFSPRWKPGMQPASRAGEK